MREKSCKNIFNIFSYLYIYNLSEYRRVSIVNVVGSNRVIETKRGYNENIGEKTRTNNNKSTFDRSKFHYCPTVVHVRSNKIN